MGHSGYALVSIVPTRSSYSYFLHTFVNPAYSKHLLNVRQKNVEKVVQGSSQASKTEVSHNTPRPKIKEMAGEGVGLPLQ